MSRFQSAVLPALALVTLAAGCAGKLRLNEQFAPTVATAVLNDRYRYTTVGSVGQLRIYFVQDRAGYSPDLVIVHAGDLREHPAIKSGKHLVYDQTGLRMFLFHPAGVERSFGRDECSARAAGVSVVRDGQRLILLLDQLFVSAGSGGHRNLIARDYLVVENGRVMVTDAGSIITYFMVGYPRYYGGEVWSSGSMSYSHCFGQTLALKGDKLVVRCRKQQFELRRLFESEEETGNKGPRGEHLWGEDFTYKCFIVPRKAQAKETKERDELLLTDLEPIR